VPQEPQVCTCARARSPIVCVQTHLLLAVWLLEEGDVNCADAHEPDDYVGAGQCLLCRL